MKKKKIQKISSRIKGSIDGISDNSIFGWAWDPENPEKRLEVVVYVDGEPVAEGVADEYREDLEKAGIGDGRYGFVIKLPETLADGEEHILYVKVKGLELILPTEQKFKAEPNQLKIKGNFDGISGLYVSGWAYNENNPDERVEIVVLVDGIPVAEAVANQFRKDLLNASIGDGKYGFKIKLPDSLVDQKEEVIKVIVKNNFRELPNSSRKIRFESKYEYKLEGIKGNLIEGKIKNILNPAEPVGIEIYENEQNLVLGYSDPDQDGKFALWLPKDVMDGRAHVFNIRTLDGYDIGYVVEITTPFLTPLDSLYQYSKEVPFHLNKIQKLRYKQFVELIKSIISNNSISAEEKVKKIKELEKLFSIVSNGYENIKYFEELVFPKFEKPKVSVIIPVHNKFELTYCCLASILLTVVDIAYEVIVVDDGSSDKTLEIQSIIKNIKVARNGISQGFVKACNKGAKLAEGEYVVILNNDTEVLENWLKEMIWEFENYERVGLVGAKLLYPDFTLQEAGGIVWGNGQVWNYGRGKNAFDPKYNYVRQVDYLSGACLMLPKRLWEELGGFDEEFAPAYWEDTDLAFRVREKGYKTVYTPFAQVIHYEGMSCGKDVKSGLKQYQTINQQKFKRKWAKVLLERKNEKNPSYELADLAKDRGIIGRVLCIDYQIPRTDKEAGGYATYQEIKLFQSLGYKVTFIPNNMEYFYGYVEDLQRDGVEVVFRPFYTSVREFIEKRGKEFDIFYIVRWWVASEYVDFIREVNPSAKILFNNADLHFLRELREAIATDNKELLLNAIQTRDKELEVMRKVDLVLSYNEVEHAVILSHNVDSTKIAKWPWVVYPKNIQVSFDERKDIAFLGNYRHFPNISAVKFFIEKVMPLLKKDLPDVRFLIYGSNVPEDFKELKGDNVVVKGYVKTLDEVFENIKVFVAPLLSGAGIKGKVLEALSYGVPSVLSPIAAEGIGIRNGFEAFIAEKPEEYVEYILKLYTDKKTWEEMSNNAITFVKSEYSFEKAKNLVRKALEMVDIFISENQEGFYRRGV